MSDRTFLSECEGVNKKQDNYSEGNFFHRDLNRSLICEGFDPDQRSLVFSSEQIQISVGTLLHIANALLEIAENRFTVKFFPLVVEIDSVDVAASWNLALTEAADEHVVFPVRKFVAG